MNIVKLHYNSFADKLDRCIEVVILSVTFLMKYVLQVKQKI